MNCNRSGIMTSYWSKHCFVLCTVYLLWFAAIVTMRRSCNSSETIVISSTYVLSFWFYEARGFNNQRWYIGTNTRYMCVCMRMYDWFNDLIPTHRYIHLYVYITHTQIYIHIHVFYTTHVWCVCMCMYDVCVCVCMMCVYVYICEVITWLLSHIAFLLTVVRCD